MPYNIKLTPAAIHDIDEAFIWYNDQATNLGYKFIENINNRLESLSITPRSADIRYDDVTMRCSENIPLPDSLFC